MAEARIVRPETLQAFSFPLLLTPPCSSTLLAVPLAVRVGRSETFVNAAVALAVALSYYILSSAAAWVKNPAYRPDLLVWMPNLVVVTLGWFLLRRASRH